MEVRTPGQEELAKLFYTTEDECSPLGEMPAGMAERMQEIERLMPEAKLTIARDWEGCAFAMVEGDERFDCFALSDDGQIGMGGVNLPVYFGSLAELIEDRREAARERLAIRRERLAERSLEVSQEDEQLLGPARFIAEPIRDRVKAEALEHGPAIEVAPAADHVSVQFDDGAWLSFGDGPEQPSAEREEQG